MKCPFRHDMECDGCGLYMENIDTGKGYYSSCAIVEIAERLTQILEALRK